MKNSVQPDQKTQFSQAKLKALERLLNSSGIQLPKEEVPLKKGNRKSAPLSYAQQRLWFIDQLQPGSTAYHMPTAVRLQGLLHVEYLEKCLSAIVKRHEVLRTRFQVGVNGELEQVVMPEEKIALKVVEVPGESEEERSKEAGALALQEFEQPFDLSAGRLFRACVLRLGPQEQILVFTIHHIISDAWSQDILLEEVKKLYAAHVKGEELYLDELPVQYTDYSVWQREWLALGVIDKQLEYWRRQLSGMKGVLDLPTDGPRSAAPSSMGARYQVQLAESLNMELKQLARRENVSLFMLLLAVFQLWLGKYARESDIAVGVPIANRARPEIEKLIGLFVNTLVMRIVVDPGESFLKFLGRVRDVALGAFANQDVPFEKLVEELRPARDLGHSPLFQVLLDVQNSRQQDQGLLGLDGVMHYLLRHESKFDLTVFLNSDETSMRCTIEFRCDLFEEQTIARMCSHLEKLLLEVVAAPEALVTSFSLLTNSERSQILYEWNKTTIAYGPESVIQMFEDQVRQTPGAIALESKAEKLNYRELNERSELLGKYLMKLGAGPNVLVGICMQRNVEMAVGLLGILKAGAAYVPLDPEYPEERLRYMIEDSGAALVLSQECLVGVLGSYAQPIGEGQPHVICLDRDWNQIAEPVAGDLKMVEAAENLAYMIYTSGSTGWPKGAGMGHRALANLVQWQMERSRSLHKQPPRTIQFTSLSFDVSFQEIFATWCVGGTLVLINEEERRDSALLWKVLRERQIERLFLPFVALQQLAELADMEEVDGAGIHLREVITAGEQLKITPALAKMFATLPECVLENQYGPTECHVVTAYRLPREHDSWPKLPWIGNPIANTQIYILSEEMELAPIGMVAEIYIGGTALGDGYHDQPALTAEKFLPHPYAAKSGERMYKTGDLGRYRSQGVIECLGRMDHQVKVRGYRIELAEVEATLVACSGVREAVVVAAEENAESRRLVGYVVLDAAGPKPSINDLKDHLKRRLPEYMIPAVLVEIGQMPLTPNGKVDRRSLPPPEKARPGSGSLPRNEVDLQLKAIWEELLQLPFVGCEESFFDLGGHSLLAIKLIRKIKEEFGVMLPLAVLFEDPTIEYLSDLIRQKHVPPPRSCLVQLQRRGLKRPVFLVHPIGGTALCFMQLVRLLESDHPFFAFQVIDDLDDEDDEQDLFATIEGRASHYLKELQKVQPRGPYLLGGWSFGGYVAYEMAQQLVRQHQEVELLMLLDITTHIGREPENADDVELTLRLANDLRELEQRPLLSLESVQHLEPQERMQYVLDVMIKDKHIDPQTDMARVHGYLKGFRKRVQSLKTYVPRRYPGTITLLRTEDVIGAEDVNPTDETRGWAGLSPNPVHLHFVPGRHHNMIFMPHVLKLAEAMKGCLQGV